MKSAKPLDEQALLFCAWCGPIFAVVYFGGLILAGQFPVFSPSLSAEEVANFYQTNTNWHRVGQVLAFLGATFYLPFQAVMSSQIRRMEGSSPINTYVQLSGGIATACINFIIPQLFLITALFRPERAPEITQMLHDFAWITMLIILNTNCVQYFAIVRAVIKDNELNAEPIFPRWIIYINYLTGLSFFIDVLVAFYRTGPFAWNGLICLYIPATIWVAWIFAMTNVLIKAIRRQAQLERGEMAPPAIQIRQPLQEGA